MIAILGILIGLFVVPDAWTIPVIAGALTLEAVETFVSLRIARRFGPARVGPERVIGQKGRVTEPCRPRGRVRVRGESWLAHCEAGADRDAEVRVVGRSGLVLLVEPLAATAIAASVRDSPARDDSGIEYTWRGAFGNDELNALHAQAFHRPLRADDWLGQVERHSLGWVCARDDGALLGWVNVAWDGGAHAFILDTIVAEQCRHRGIGTGLVMLAAHEARNAGCEWLHVDFDDELAPFYIEAAGFRPTKAGLIDLTPGPR